MKRITRTLGLSANKRALLDAMLNEEGVAASRRQTISPRKDPNPCVLSFGQQRLWFLDQMEPDNSVYNVPFALSLSGPLDKVALERSLSEIVRRHEALRTSFPVIDGEPKQVVGPASTLTLATTDLSELAEAERRLRVEQLLREEAQRPFDLTHGLLLRASLLRLGSEEHILQLTMHHIAADAWSVGVFSRELNRLYHAYSNGESSPLEELPIQYADFAVWQRERLEGEVLDQQLEYWRRQLSAVEPLELPADHPRPAIRSFRGKLYQFKFRKNLNEELKAFSQREGVTLFMTLLAGWQVLLARYSGQDQIVIGSPIAGRTLGETEGLIGFFVNTLVLRGDLSGNPSFIELLQRVKETCLGAYAHQEVPFERLVEELEPERHLNNNPLFQVMFALQNAPGEAAALQGLKMRALPVDSQNAIFDLTLMLQDGPNELRALLQFDTDLYEDATVKRMLEHYEIVLASLVANPRAKLSELTILTAAEQQQLAEWNDTARPLPEDSCIHQLFEEQVLLTPEAPAVSYEKEQLSYAELNARANRLAHYLREQGVGAEVLVGICMERSVEMVVSLLAILKAGGAYVPLDPSYPAQRLNYMLQDAGVGVLLSEHKLRERLAVTERVPVLCREDWSAELASYSAANPAVELSAANLAYVIYTSGSTGEPKGIAVVHRGVVRLVRNTDFVQLTAGDRIAQASNTSFDASTFEVWGALLNGAELIGISQEIALSATGLAHEIREKQVSTLFLTTALFNQLSRDGGDCFAGMREVLFGGEAVDAGSVRRVLEAGGPERVLHVYGPTESTTFATWEQVHEVSEKAVSVPIGKPIGNTTVYVLDAGMQMAPVGVRGELYIGGEGLARGYLQRPELTAERFVPHPYSSVGGERLYRTGDEVRWRADGRLEFIGRVDQQVKLRGYRIELGEIEAVLSAQAGVSEAVVVMREDEPGDKRLVGYVVGETGAQVNSSELRRGLQERLPEYMVPAVLVVLEQLPLTANGKVNRRELPAPDGSRPELAAAYVGPRTVVEEVLVEIWKEVLRVEQVGIHDNFFELGGHSLLATQVVSRVRQVLQRELGLRSLFERPAIAGLAEQLEGKSESVAPEIVAVDREQVLPLSFAQQRLWLIEQLETGTAAYNIPAAIRLRGQLRVPVLEAALTEVLRRHEVLRTTFETVDGQPLQVIGEARNVSLPVQELSRLGEQEREAAAAEVIEREARAGFDLESGPLMRARLLRLGAEEHVLLLTMHHIVSDGWSTGVLVKELSVLYAAYAQEQASPLPELGIQYADYAVWQREWLQGEVLQEQLRYWREQLQGAPEVLELPTDHPRPAVQSFRGGQQQVVLPAAVSEGLKELSRREGVTLFMTLLAAWQVLLARYSGQEEVVVGSPIAGRTRGETEGLIGFFVNTLVLRGDLRGDPSFVELLQRVKEVCLGAYGHQDVPFEKLVEELQPERSLSHNPLFQVMFVLQNAPREVLQLPGLELSAVKVENTTTKFDLTLGMEDGKTGLGMALEYNTDLFDSSTITRMLGHFETLLAGIVAAPQQRLSELPLLTAAEQAQLVEWNDTARPFSGDTCIHQLFEEQERLTPEAAAVSFEKEQLSYAELNARANQLAHYLRKHGVGADVRVGIYMERSVELVVSLLAVLKAGGAYVPLDPSYPSQRLLYMLQDAGAKVLLTQAKLIDQLPHDCQVAVDAEWGTIANESEQNPAALASLDNLAYVIYTSGSTGQPKGVMIDHRGIRNRLIWMQETYQLTAQDRVLQKTPFSFDVSVWEFFWTLITGAELVVAQPGGHQDSAYLRDLIAERRITTIHFVPSMLQMFLEQEGVERCHSLRQVICSGEALQAATQERFFEKFTAQLHNLYGPTEASIDVTFWACQRGENSRPVPIGYPIANTQMHILDAKLQPVPVGVPGELWIGGVGLARGYLNRPELTAEKFIPNPFSRAQGMRLYRTGDLARYLPNGSIEFLGRVDHQVKLRGFRIELSEIETALNAHPEVRESVVIVREDTLGEQRLVAYLVAASAPSVTELRHYLKEILPEHMVPGAFVVLDKLPLSANGKIDRKALPAPDGARPELEKAFIAPATPLEQMIAAIWTEVLDVEEVGIHDNFFELGGHSLIAMMLVSRVREKLQVDLPLRTIFTFPTVAELAVGLTQILAEQQVSQDIDQLLEELEQMA